MSKVQGMSVVAFLSFCMIVGAVVFARGFLLNRQVIHETAGPCLGSHNVHIRSGMDSSSRSSTPREVGGDGGLGSMANWCNPSPPFNKIVLVLVDALRFDFVQRMDFLSSLAFKKDGRLKDLSCLFKFVADPPTTTMQRLKALMTGTMPTFIDASANFNSYEVEEDSLIHQLHAIGKRIAFLGDDTWLSLFPPKYFKSPFVEGHPSFNAWDLDTVDRAVNKTLQEIFLEPSRNEWDVLISHILGVDHCGHRYGPSHPEMVRKLHEADSMVKYVFNSMSDDTLLVVFGDHGMTATGDHGGDSKDETEAAVIFISKEQSKFNPPYQCHPGPDVLAISQIDLVPTLASLMGIPVPYSNIGQTIPAFLRNKISSDATAANVAQVNKYIQNFPGMFTSGETDINLQDGNLVQQYKKIEEAFQEYQSAPNVTSRDKLLKLSSSYLSRVKSAAVSAWTQFNMPMIYTGILITLLSVLSLVLYLVFATTMKGRYSVLSWLWPSLAHWSVLCTFVYHSVSTALLGITISTFSGLFVFLILLGFRVIRHFGTEFKPSNISDVTSIILYSATCLAVLSNSFTVYEGHVLGFILCVVSLIEVISKRYNIILQDWNFGRSGLGFFVENIATTPENAVQLSKIRKELKCSWSCFFTMIFLIRTSHIFFRCREEQTTCSEEFLLHKQLSSLPEDWLVHKYLRYGVSLLVLAIFAVSFRHWMFYRNCIFSKKPRALISRFVPSMLVVFLGVFWALQGLPYISAYVSRIPLLMSYLPLVYQAVTLTAIVCIVVHPICCVGHLKHSPYAKLSPAIAEGDNKLMKPQDRVKQNGHLIQRQQNSTSSTSTVPKLSNGVHKKKASNGVNGVAATINSKERRDYQGKKQTTSISLPLDCLGVTGCDCVCEDTYSSSFLTMSSLVTLLLVQVTSTGLAPAIIIHAYTLVCIVGIFRKRTIEEADSWSSAVAWTLASQFFFYATGHQPIFAAIPWDSAFVGGGDGAGLASTSGEWLPWARAGLAVTGNLHVSQILSSVALPLLVYWSVDKNKMESRMGKVEREKAISLYGKFVALHGLKLLLCMVCAGWHRRHLMVWKIFAPKLIFEAASFILTSTVSLLGMLYLNRVNYCHQKFLDVSQKSI